MKRSRAVRLASLYADLASGRGRTVRAAARLSQSDVARAVGATHAAVSAWECGRRKPKGDLALRYGALLDALRDVSGPSEGKAVR